MLPAPLGRCARSNPPRPLWVGTDRTPESTRLSPCTCGRGTSRSPQTCIPPRVRSPVQMMISVRAGRCSFTAFSVAVTRFGFRASLPRRRRLSGPGADVAVGVRLEPLDDVAVVGEAAGEEMRQERGCGVVGKRDCGAHDAVLRPVVGNDGDVLPGTSTRRPAFGQTPFSRRRVRARTSARPRAAARTAAGEPPVRWPARTGCAAPGRAASRPAGAARRRRVEEAMAQSRGRSGWARRRLGMRTVAGPTTRGFHLSRAQVEPVVAAAKLDRK